MRSAENLCPGQVHRGEQGGFRLGCTHSRRSSIRIIWALEMNLPKVTLLVRRRPGIQTQFYTLPAV